MYKGRLNLIDEIISSNCWAGQTNTRTKDSPALAEVNHQVPFALIMSISRYTIGKGI